MVKNKAKVLRVPKWATGQTEATAPTSTPIADFSSIPTVSSADLVAYVCSQLRDGNDLVFFSDKSLRIIKTSCLQYCMVVIGMAHAPKRAVPDLASLFEVCSGVITAKYSCLDVGHPYRFSDLGWARVEEPLDGNASSARAYPCALIPLVRLPNMDLATRLQSALLSLT